MHGPEYLRQEFHKRLLKARTIYRLMCTDQFESACKRANKHEYELLSKAITTTDTYALKNAIKNILYKGLEAKTLRELRSLAAQHSIVNYSRKTRFELIHKLMEIPDGPNRSIDESARGDEAFLACLGDTDDTSEDQEEGF